jgi:ribonuclease BN (tRNA processing enzyme)
MVALGQAYANGRGMPRTMPSASLAQEGRPNGQCRCLGKFGATTFAAIDALAKPNQPRLICRPMRLTIIGCGDAFGAGGRLQTSFHVRTGSSSVLIDCGTSTLIGMRRLGLDPAEIDAVFVSHLHGDHFGGLPWLLIDAEFVIKRTRPLLVFGPRGIEARFRTLAEAVYPAVTTGEGTFQFTFVEYEERAPVEIAGISVTPFEVHHPSGAPPYALRFALEGKVVAFTGDTGWVDALYDVARGNDLFITECFQYDVVMPIHLDYQTIDANYAKLGAKRVLLTHMSEAMLEKMGLVDGSRYLIAHDGMTLDL